MRVLVCDDDVSLRFAVRRLLEDRVGCTVVEAADGAEALSVLSRQSFSLALLDVDMPELNGFETLTEIRASGLTRSLPVIVLSNERRETAIVELMQLGIAGYILKPLHHQTFVDRVTEVMESLRMAGHAGDEGPALVGPDAPCLVVDGDLEYRTFFSNCVSAFGPVLQAESGAAALAAFKRQQVGVVFIGTGLGIVTAERLAERLQDASAGGLQLIRISEQSGAAAGRFDAVIQRGFVPEALREAVRPFVKVSGPIQELQGAVPGFLSALHCSTRHVFGSAFGEEPVRRSVSGLVPLALSACVPVALHNGLDLTVSVYLSSELAERPATVKADSAVGLDAVRALVEGLAGRLLATCDEAGLSGSAGVAVTASQPVYEAPAFAHGVAARWEMPSGGGFVIAIGAERQVMAGAPPVEPVMPLTQPLAS